MCVCTCKGAIKIVINRIPVSVFQRIPIKQINGEALDLNPNGVVAHIDSRVENRSNIADKNRAFPLSGPVNRFSNVLPSTFVASR